MSHFLQPVLPLQLSHVFPRFQGVYLPLAYPGAWHVRNYKRFILSSFFNKFTTNPALLLPGVYGKQLCSNIIILTTPFPPNFMHLFTIVSVPNTLWLCSLTIRFSISSTVKFSLRLFGSTVFLIWNLVSHDPVQCFNKKYSLWEPLVSFSILPVLRYYLFTTNQSYAYRLKECHLCLLPSCAQFYTTFFKKFTYMLRHKIDPAKQKKGLAVTYVMHKMWYITA